MTGSKATIVFAIFTFIAVSKAHEFDITKFGARPGSEISKALDAAWKAACCAPKPSKLIIPKGHFCLNVFEFRGPCKAPIEVRIDAILTGPKDPALIPKGKQWITFSYLNGMTLSGT
ncbi:putative endo-polygalacturonase [Helianthus annuus]|nr:putative endo-polygalacturonase [Helianthus annuus]KAJ0715722.1 putative endo-polygalacturonase [Helianthus annuus]KAJ0856693.1 putative endo-polygalacturonase [Helianthus annuus]